MAGAGGPAPPRWLEVALIAALRPRALAQPASSCHPPGGARSSVLAVTVILAPPWLLTSVPVGTTADSRARPVTAAVTAAVALDEVDGLVLALFREQGSSLVRLARLFVDDRNAAEDLVQEAFIRLARNAHRIEDRSKAAAYLRSIVLNLARDSNRRGLVSLRQQLPLDDRVAATEDTIVVREGQRQVLDAVRALAHRQRDCVVLRYYDELGIADIAAALGISENSVKTHLKRGLAALERTLGPPREAGS